MNLHKQNFVCWPSVGPQDIKQTYIHTYMCAGARAARFGALYEAWIKRSVWEDWSALLQHLLHSSWMHA